MTSHEFYYKQWWNLKSKAFLSAFVNCCSRTNLEFSTKKKNELFFFFSPSFLSLWISLKFLGSYLKLEGNTKTALTKKHQRYQHFSWGKCGYLVFQKNETAFFLYTSVEFMITCITVGYGQSHYPQQFTQWVIIFILLHQTNCSRAWKLVENASIVALILRQSRL